MKHQPAIKEKVGGELWQIFVEAIEWLGLCTTGRLFSISYNYPPGFPDGSAGKESTCNVGDLGLLPGLGRSPGEGKGYPLQHSGLETSMDCIVHGVTKSRTRLSDFHFHCLSHRYGIQ